MSDSFEGKKNSLSKAPIKSLGLIARKFLTKNTIFYLISALETEIKIASNLTGCFTKEFLHTLHENVLF